MADTDSPESPLDAVAETVGEGTIEAFEVLGNELRLAVLLALWEAYVPFAEDNALSFSELYDRVGARDSGNFNYHLGELVGPFVEQTEAGYTLTTRAEQILRAVLAGTLTEHTTFEGEPIDAECSHCGGSMVVDYRDSILVERCTDCAGRWEHSESPSGVLRYVYRPPVGLENRTPQEFHRHGNTWDRYQAMSMVEGVCPDCSGAVTTSISVCEDHDVREGAVCEHCGSFWEIQLQTVCEVCKAEARMAPFAPIHTDLRVKTFYHDHGVDPDELYDAADIAAIRDTIAEKTVVARDPPEILIAIDIDGDRLEVTLDDEGRVIDVRERE